ncbi:hypothetical protein [Streptococcus infantarius]|uniref:hypothetical protein n=1 Tax=Streptococcus infantarius TaxID=102684 RepID=UPI0022E65FC1|nr:hypothetical protein [Streptococcus infantarius]
MQMEHVTDSVTIYSDGTNLQVIHDLGQEFVLDLELEKEPAFNIDDLGKTGYAYRLKARFSVSVFYSKGEADLHRLRWAILQLQEFEQFLTVNQAKMLEWYFNPKGETE